MKNLLKIFLIICLFQSSSCAYLFNEKEVELSIASNPAGADIIIEGKNYGQTPKMLMIEPKNYDVLLRLPGYGSTNIKLQTWQTIRNREQDGERCIADSMGFIFILPLLSMWSVYCRDFKEKNQFVNIPQNDTGLNRPLPHDFYEMRKSYQDQQSSSHYNNYHNIKKDSIGSNNVISNKGMFNGKNMQKTYDPFIEDDIHYDYQQKYRYNSSDVSKQRVAPQRNYIEGNQRSLGENLYRDSYKGAPQLQKFPGKFKNPQPYKNPSDLDNKRQSIEEMYMEDMKKNLY